MRLVPYLFVIATIALIVLAIYSVAKRTLTPKDPNSDRTMPYGVFLPLLVTFMVIWGIFLVLMLVHVFDVIPW